MMEFKLRTDTATLAIFDVEELRHRISDAADWWTDPDEAVAEMNQGRVAFIDLAADGVFHVRVHRGPVRAGEIGGAVRVRCRSGRLFVGPGEVTVSAGLVPDEEAGGVSLDVPAGAYRVSVVEAGPATIELSLEAVDGEAKNELSDYLRIVRS